MSSTTVLLPIKRNATEKEEEWLKVALGSLPEDTPYLILRNDGEVVDALNAGLNASKTEFIVAMGADDALFPDYIAHLEGPAWNADVVYPAVTLADEDLNPLAKIDADPFCPIRLEQMNYLIGPSLIRRSKAVEVGGYREIGGVEDWDLFVRIARSGGRLKPCPAANYLYRRHPDSRNAKVRDDPVHREELRRAIVGEYDATRKALATFYVQATPGVTYLRAQLPGRHLPGLVTTFLDSLMNEEELLFPDHLGKAAIFVHPGDKGRALAMQGLMETGVKGLVEVDDNYLLNPGKEILQRSGWHLKIGDGVHTRQGHRWIAKHADGVIVTTQSLADAYHKVNPNVYICPNTVDPIDWPDPQKPDDGIFRIGWLASLSHRPDIPLITRAFEWAAAQKDVEVYITSSNPETGAAGLDPSWKFKYGRVPWVDDLDAYRKLFSYFDVVVCPIKATPFAVYRSDVKALEAAMGLAAPILSDVPPYSEWDDTRSIKAKDARGFYHAIKHLVANRDEAKQLAQAARDYTLKERTTEAQIHLWKEAIE